MRRGLSITVVLALALAPGCYREFIVVNDPDGAPLPWDAGVVLLTSKCEEPTGIDLLFVVDNSNSMTEEQESLAEQLPALVRALVDPPDRDGDTEPDWLPIVDLHVGVVTTDMGTGGFTVPTCARADFGDDGILRTAGRADVEGCASTYPSFPTYAGGSADAFAFDASCVVRTGTGGCGFEQQLEAALKALSPAAPTAYTGPSYEPPTFFRGTSGHGDRENRGFLRDDTLLAVVIVTDEEDCSAHDPDLFNPSSLVYGGTDLNLRCFAHQDQAVHPVERYVTGLSALRASRPDLLALGLVVGVPEDLAVESPSYDQFRAMLADDRMQERVDPTMPNRLVPSCDTPRGIAFPPRRLVSLAQGIGPGRSTVQSICQADFTPVAAALARLFGQRACRRFEE
ncbi:MAG: hypothetical protein M5U28_00140 [Sandaracinaceae bacterium]|nr:hypothetical protein [Sandaracinaceae bacterium]